MKFLRFFLVILSITTSIFCTSITNHLLLKKTEEQEKQSHKTPKILLCCTNNYVFSGAFLYRVNLLKLLTKHNYAFLALASRQMSDDKFLEMHSIKKSCIRRTRSYSIRNIFAAMRDICRREKVSIIHTNTREELLAAKKMAALIPIRIVHSVLGSLALDSSGNLKEQDHALFCGVDCIITVNPELAAQITEANQQHKLKIGRVVWIPPFIDENRFLNHQPKLTKTEFFQQFGVTLDNHLPVVTTIANFYPCKNHKRLLSALATLIKDHKKPVEMVFAGNGTTGDLKELARTLGIDKYIHFLGFTNDTPSLLYYSDIKILPSYRETFAMVLLEAGLMKKPLIGARGTGMECTINHELTGLLIDPSNPNDITAKIERYLDEPTFAKQMGENAYSFIKSTYSVEENFKKLQEVYKFVSSRKQEC